MKNNKLIVLSIALLSGSVVIGQTSPLTDGPANAEVGKCYAKCYTGSTYKTVTEEVLVKPATKKMVVTPAVYETKTEKVMVTPASKRYQNVPAKFETQTEEMLVKEASKKLVTVPARYETKTERILVSPASEKWVKKRTSGCLSEDPNDCMIVCLEAVPAQYKTVTSSVVSTPASVSEVEVPAQYKTIYKKVIKTPATTNEVEIPAEFKTVTMRVLKTPASVTEVEVPAQYKTITKKELVKKGEYGAWKEILCDSKVTSSKIRQIQNALIAKGYDVGTAGADNVMGADTRAALIKYQRDNNLPEGNLNIETLKSLGVSTN